MPPRGTSSRILPPQAPALAICQPEERGTEAELIERNSSPAKRPPSDPPITTACLGCARLVLHRTPCQYVLCAPLALVIRRIAPVGSPALPDLCTR